MILIYYVVILTIDMDNIIKQTYDLDLTNFLSDICSDRSGGSYLAADGADFGRQNVVDKIYDNINDINWNNEANYHNSYLVNGKNNIGRTIKLKK